ANDIERATELARKMVCEWGMSDLIGPMAIGKKEENIFLGREIHQNSTISQKTAETVDAEVHRIITKNYDRAKLLLQEKVETLHTLAQALLEREVLDREEIELVMQGKPLPAPAPATAPEEPKAVESVTLPGLAKPNTNVA